ncbi:V-type proton ATPase subunit E-like [Homalodisca vitripennis]|uniref:V-type proton ATPase subunit E-like n=1 Tax=Homalodisca vitripennis TaxID=197043 RepID=UPI001EECEF61|nr:V-type proton ATPase subunit E-like [Homalodisca vitripennis]
MNRYKPSLSRNDIESQIHRMVAFIDHEARERAEEIDSKTEGEFCYEKGRLLHKARQDMQRIYEKKEITVYKQDQTTEATLQNRARLRELACREAHISRIEAEVQDRLLKKNEDPELYRNILLEMLIQGLFRMLERVVLVRVREQDLTIIEELLEPAKDRYKEKVGRRVKIVVDSSRYLAPSCLGGVELATPNRKVRVINTFLSRLQLIVKQLVPAIRRHLFEQGPLSRHESVYSFFEKA